MASLPGLGVAVVPDPGFRYAPPQAIVLRPSGALFSAESAPGNSPGPWLRVERPIHRLALKAA
jgi:hypothetical protein